MCVCMYVCMYCITNTGNVEKSVPIKSGTDKFGHSL